MSNWKRFVLILTAAVMTLPLYCCGEKEETSGSSVSDSDENTSSQESNSDGESSESAAEITAATEQAPIPQEYDFPEDSQESDRFHRILPKYPLKACSFQQCLNVYVFCRITGDCL